MSFKVIAKYIKKIEFNIPSTKTFFLLSEEIKNYKIKIDIKSNQFKDQYTGYIHITRGTY